MELTELDKAIIVTIYKRSGKSKKAHFPIEFICKGYPKHLHGMIKSRVKKLVKLGYLYNKPHPSGMSYGLTNDGWQLAKKLHEE
ncbi:hypothetical protein Asulf_02266 [Archaeoglobus sulfaticallidus PM70-1]|uniref:Uncharacterized protein n=1 Tax=Archaeoglobus sulfaticallidus PM70-1 TaxID=387631 RepID=N0BEY8_9EURY|nr:hypothetical protein [Archaeoglobus sulfaticallidus]AGK62219.1 hypothetical protein Asulf_02266 [Archaeoglobus sulfaticallidus PM70-1]